MAISMLKIRRPLGRLIFNMGIAIPGKTVFLIETAPWYPIFYTQFSFTRYARNILYGYCQHNVDVLVQERGHSIADAMELGLSSTSPSL